MIRQSATDVLIWKKAIQYKLVFLVGLVGATGHFATADDVPRSKIIEYRGTHPSIDLVDSIRVLSEDNAQKFQNEIRAAFQKLAPSVVRIYFHDMNGNAFDEHGFAVVGGVSGVIIRQDGLILTCSHHRIASGTVVTVELNDGKRVTGKMLGRFDDAGPDIGFALLTESNEWPVASLSDAAFPVGGQVCLAIGYPGNLNPGRPPLLRAGRIIPNSTSSHSADWPLLEATTTSLPGDSGGPLFDLSGRVIGVVRGHIVTGITRYESVVRLNAFRDRLEAGEVVSDLALPRVRALRGRRPQMGAFSPALDIEDRVQQVSKNFIQIMDGPHVIAAGLIVDKSGWAVTKASLVGYRREWTCRVFYTQEGKMLVKGRVVANSPEHDLALMRFDLHDWLDVPWADERPSTGMFVSTCLGTTVGPLQMAIVGADAFAEHAISSDIPQIPLSLTSDQPSKVVVQLDGCKTAEFDVFRDRFQPGDVITHLNGIETPTRSDYGRVIDELTYAVDPTTGVNYEKPSSGSYHGDWIAVGIRRNGVDLTVWIPKIHSVTMGGLDWHSHPLSLRRESFPSVFSHDAIIRPEQCGGPVMDLEGRVVGLNIARADGTRTLAIPVDVVRKVIADLRKQVEE